MSNPLDGDEVEIMPQIDRRDFLKLAGAGAAALALPQWVRAAQAQGKKPNILVIMSDEHNAKILGCYGNEIARTPNLDALAARGVVFENNYCNSPLCVPSRQSFTAGRFASRVSAWNNGCRMPDNSADVLPRLLDEAGYDSVLCGKMHYDAQCRYGFRDVGGNMNTGHMGGRGGRMSLDKVLAHTPLSPRFDDFHTGGESSVIKHDLRVTRGATEFLRARRQDHAKPFFMLCGFLAPHFPLIVPEQYWKNFEGKIPMPEIPAGFIESLPRNYKALRAGFEYTDVPPETVQRGRELYYGLTQWMDERVGEVLRALEESGEADNTVIVYTSDHGENMGEHGLWWKNALYDNAAKVPLIISWPVRWQGGQRRTQVCSLVDLVATLADLGGCKVPASWNGTPMTGWLDDPKAPWKDLAVSEYYAHNITSGYAMLRQGDWKYVYHTAADASHPAERELYNLKEDPAEMHNLAVRPEQGDRIAEMHARLLKELGEDPAATEMRCRAETARGYGNGVGGNGAGEDDAADVGGEGAGAGKKKSGVRARKGKGKGRAGRKGKKAKA